MQKLLIFFITIIVLVACQSPKKNALYESDKFSVYPDKIVQGTNESIVISPTHIKSNYKSPASTTFSRLIKFKFSINEKDNELAPGADHWVMIGDEHQSPVVTFGHTPEPSPAEPSTYLPVNYEYTFRADISPVLKQF